MATEEGALEVLLHATRAVPIVFNSIADPVEWRPAPADECVFVGAS